MIIRKVPGVQISCGLMEEHTDRKAPPAGKVMEKCFGGFHLTKHTL